MRSPRGCGFRGGTVADFLDGLDGRLGVNMGANVGHCAVRRQIMGDDASERTATADEIGAMQVLVRAALSDGAMGFTSSQLELHVAHDGRGVPSNHADHDELIALAGVLAEFGRGSIEFIPRSFLIGYDDEDRALIRAMARASGRPVHLNTLTSMPHAPDGWSRSLEFAETAAEDGLAIHPMFATNRQGVHFSLGSTFLFDEMPTFRETLTLSSPARQERLRDQTIRDRLRTELADPAGRSFVFAWEVLRVERVVKPANERWLDTSISEIARATNADPLDAFLDLSLDEDLETQFVVARPPSPERLDAIARMIRSPVVMAGSSDGGAHLLSFCGADYTTRLLTEWVPSVLTLEQAVARTERDTGAGHRNRRSGNAHHRHGCRRPGDRPRVARGGFGPVRAGLPCRLGTVRGRRDRLSRSHRQWRTVARGRNLDRRDSGTGHEVPLSGS